MYTKESEEHQLSFTHDWFVVPEVDENHELIKIAKAIDWVSVSEKLSRFYCADNGRPAKPSRAKVGLLILKHLYRYSDVELADLIKRDIYAQYLCDVSLKEAKNFINPSTLSKFRKQDEFIKEAQNFLDTACKILTQQKDVYHGLPDCRRRRDVDTFRAYGDES